MEAQIIQKKFWQIYQKKNGVKFFTHIKNLGQSTAINTGIKNSTYNNIVTIDADGQNNPNDIKYLLEVFFTKNYVKHNV